MYKSIQGCRALAALLVVLHHLGGALASSKYFGAESFALAFKSGDSGVEFFFVLSGFIITWAHFDDFGRPRQLLRYLRKRCVRIYPTYWIVFGIAYLALQLSATSRSTVPHDFYTLLRSLALLPQDPLIVGGSGAPVLIVAWSLQYEICFYLLFAAFIMNRALGMFLCIPLAINVAACHVDSCVFPRSFFSNNLVLLFAFGVLIAHCSRIQMLLKRPILVAAAGVTAYLLFAILEGVVGQDAISVDRRLIYGLLSGVIIFSLVKSEEHGHLRIQSRWPSLLGDSSYSLYLIHYPLISGLCKLLIVLGLAGGVGAAIAFPIIIAACIASALAFHIHVEKRILNFLSARRPTTTLHPSRHTRS